MLMVIGMEMEMEIMEDGRDERRLRGRGRREDNRYFELARRSFGKTDRPGPLLHALLSTRCHRWALNFLETPP
jgi:hypothetical protein